MQKSGQEPSKAKLFKYDKTVPLLSQRMASSTVRTVLSHIKLG